MDSLKSKLIIDFSTLFDKESYIKNEINLLILKCNRC